MLVQASVGICCTDPIFVGRDKEGTEVMTQCDRSDSRSLEVIQIRFEVKATTPWVTCLAIYQRESVAVDIRPLLVPSQSATIAKVIDGQRHVKPHAG